MTAKDVLLKVAETLPDDATDVDAIHQIEAGFAELREQRNRLATRQDAAPSWLYDSPSRVQMIHQQMRKRDGAARIVAGN